MSDKVEGSRARTLRVSGAMDWTDISLEPKGNAGGADHSASPSVKTHAGADYNASVRPRSEEVLGTAPRSKVHLMPDDDAL